MASFGQKLAGALLASSLIACSDPTAPRELMNVRVTADLGTDDQVRISVYNDSPRTIYLREDTCGQDFQYEIGDDWRLVYPNMICFLVTVPTIPIEPGEKHTYEPYSAGGLRPARYRFKLDLWDEAGWLPDNIRISNTFRIGR